MNIHRALLYLFPDYQKGDWEIRDDSDGVGAKIVSWSRADPRPTVPALEAAWTSATQTDRIAKKKVEIKIEVQRRILTKLPGATLENYRDKELNYLARQAELEAIESGRYRDATGALQPARTLTAAEVDEIKSFVAFWNWVKANRNASNLIEADVAASTDPANFDVAGSSRWPT